MNGPLCRAVISLAVSLVLNVGSVAGTYFGRWGLAGGVRLVILGHLGVAAVLLGRSTASIAPPDGSPGAVVSPVAEAEGLAHDVNHLVGLIADYADCVHERVVVDHPEGCWSAEVTREVIHDSASLLACAHQVGALVDRLLSLGGVTHSSGPLDLNRLVAGMETLFTSEGRSRIILDYGFEPDLWPVRADRIGLEQVLMNLCGNARQAMVDGGRLSIRTENVLIDHQAVLHCGLLGPGLEPGPYVCLTVVDTGSGMTPEVLARSAEPGFTTRSHGANVGVGLSTVVNLLARMGGALALRSGPGKGTEARAFIPADTVTG